DEYSSSSCPLGWLLAAVQVVPRHVGRQYQGVPPRVPVCREPSPGVQISLHSADAGELLLVAQDMRQAPPSVHLLEHADHIGDQRSRTVQTALGGGIDPEDVLRGDRV